MAPAFVDTHAHIQEADFTGDLDAVLDRSRAAAIKAIVVPGVDVETSESALVLASCHPDVYFAAGLHPHEAVRLDSTSLDSLRRLLEHPRAVAVGEIGLDYYRMHSPRDAQLAAFDAMLALALETRLPVIVHSREAGADVRDRLLSWSLRVRSAYAGRLLGVMHYFSGTADEARVYLEMGFLISVHTSVTHPKAHTLRRVVAELPLEALVIETDSPYGAPQSVRGQRNEPANVIEAAARIAEVTGCSLEEVARLTTANAARVFRLPITESADLTGVRA